jgi:ABC-2 type transport system ATP-binding protein
MRRGAPYAKDGASRESAPVIEVSNLVYEYPNKRALHGVSLSVAPGTITALVGPNGAGKTTLLRCLAALEEPFSGKVSIDGRDTVADPRGVHERLGYLPDFFGLYDILTVRQNLTFAARSHGLSGAKAREAVDKAARRTGILDRMDSRAVELSRGLRQRLAISQAIVHEPKVILLDEPAAGLDPDARRSLSELFIQLRDQGLTLLVSSHILSELEDYSSTMIIVQNGRIAGGGAVTVGGGRDLYRLELESPNPRAAQVLIAAGAEDIMETGAVLTFALGSAAARPALLRAAIESGLAVVAFSAQRQTLEELYLNISAEARGQT